VEAAGPGPMNFQWFVGAAGETTIPVGGAISATFTTPAITATTRYWVRVSAAGSAVDSATATVAVDAVPPAIAEQPEDENIVSGQTARLEVEATGTGPLTYQWFLGGAGSTENPIGGAGESRFTTPPLTETTRYWVRVSNAAGSADSTTATVTVAAAAAPPPATPPPATPPPATPPPATPPPAAPPADPNATSFEDAVLSLVNQRRAAGATCGGTAYPGVGAMSMNTNLRVAARDHSQDMGALNYFSHTSLDGRTFTQRIFNAGYTGSGPYGENIGAGYGSAAAVVNGWMASTGHCQNIMNGGFRVAGVGYAYVAGSTYGHYWTLNFGGG